MATDATFDNQLQALANATATFANGKDAAIKNTIITALGGSTQQSGGSTKLEPTLTVTHNSSESYSYQITFDVVYDGDGLICTHVHDTSDLPHYSASNLATCYESYAFTEGHYRIEVYYDSGSRFTDIPAGEYELTVAATETDNFAAKSVSITYTVD